MTTTTDTGTDRARPIETTLRAIDAVLSQHDLTTAAADKALTGSDFLAACHDVVAMQTAARARRREAKQQRQQRRT